MVHNLRDGIADFWCNPRLGVYSPQKPSPGKRLKAGINTGANGVTALLGRRDRKKHWARTCKRLSVTHTVSQLPSGNLVSRCLA